MQVAVMGRGRLHRSALAEVLQTEPDVDVVAVKRSAANLAAACGEKQPDVVVVILDAGEAGDALDTDAVRERFPASHLVAVGSEPSGAPAGPFDAVIAPDDAIGSLLRAMRTRAAAAPRVAVLASDPDTGSGGPGASLTDREVQILWLISEGRTAADIGRALGVSAKTVDSHRRRIYTKLGVRTQTHAVARAVRDGVLGTGAPRQGGPTDRGVQPDR